MRALRGAVLAAALIVTVCQTPAWADRCPYCGQEYGDAAPGDEARVYALRAEHEASCPYRNSGSGGGAASGGSPRWTRQDQIEYERELAIEQERQRQIAEEKRKLKIRQEAAERAENEARRLRWEEKKKSLASMLKGAAPSVADTGLKSSGGEDIFLTPRGVKNRPDELIGEEKAEAVRTKTLKPGALTDAADSGSENLRRSLWLYQKAAAAPTRQESEFLLGQADEAAQGHPLKVEVPPAAEIPSITPEKLERFKAIKTEIETERIQSDLLKSKKRGLEDRRNLQKRGVEDLEIRLQELRARKQAAPADPVNAGAPAPAPAPADPAEEAKEKKNPEEDLLAQLLEAQKKMEQADNELGELESRQQESDAKISEGEKKIGELLG
ncbi:MAG TPA: hypothetical protein VL404_06750 [Candidatus Eisenbacteria bacterium]|nr:hypothetical protein [Candidatus Eisenbacteria bacterium]